MTQDKLARMADVTKAIYMTEFQKVQGLLEEEARLRKDLARLRAQSVQGRETLQTDPSMQAVGADLLWQSWLNRTQRQLNMDLARVMARKLTAMDRVRRAFGKQSAVRSMLETRDRERREKARKKALETLLNRHV
jgi:hypothetical protein